MKEKKRKIHSDRQKIHKEKKPEKIDKVVENEEIKN